MFGLKDAGEDTLKSLRQAYRLWLLLGVFGAHRFYLGRGTSGATMMVLTVLGLVLLFSHAGAAFLSLVGVWLVIDGLALPRMVCRSNRQQDDLGPCAATRLEDRAWH